MLVKDDGENSNFDFIWTSIPDVHATTHGIPSPEELRAMSSHSAGHLGSDLPCHLAGANFPVLAGSWG